MRLRSVVAVLVLVVSSVPAGVATPSAQSEYRSMVEEYRRGRRGVLDKVGTADAPQIDGWLELARSTDSKAWDWETVRDAAIMHTEAWSRRCAISATTRRRFTWRHRAVCSSASGISRHLRATSSSDGEPW